MKAILSIITSLLMAATASASDFAVVLGARSNSADADVTGLTVDSKTGMGIGVLGFFDLAGAVQGRMGMIINQRNFTLKSSSTYSNDLNTTYMDIPLTVNYKFVDYAGVFAGPVASLLAAKSQSANVSSFELSKSPESFNLGFQFGASFKFAPQLGAELYYESIPSTIWKEGVKDVKTVGLNFLMTFE